MENLYEAQKSNIKNNLCEFIETSYTRLDKSLALLLINGLRFIDQSSVIRYPEFTLDEDFDLCLDWTKDKHNTFSLSIDKEGLCSYAYIKGYSLEDGLLKGEQAHRGRGRFKLGSSEFDDFKTSMSIIIEDIFHV